MKRAERRALVLLTGAAATAALGAAVQVGGALLLYTGQGLLAAAGFLLALVLAAVGAGMWVGGPENRASRGRWAAAAIGYAVAAVFAGLWMGVPALQAPGAARALAVLLLLAAPAYITGSLLSVLHARHVGPPGEMGALPLAALCGAAFGVLAAAVSLIPRLEPGTIYLACAGAVALAGLVEMRLRTGTRGEEDATMRGKVVLVTGVGGRGQVGYALALALLADGAKLVVTGASAEIEERGRELAGHGEVVAIQADLTVPDGAAAVVRTAVDRHGRLDALINVAGGLTVMKPAAETSVEEWRREIERNATTAFLMCRAALPALRESRGAIVNFASPSALRAQGSLAAYSAAKAGVVALTRALAVEEKASGVRVNAIAPGLIDTEQNRASVGDEATAAWVSRDEVARVVRFLASDAAAAVTGETVHVLGRGIE